MARIEKTVFISYRRKDRWPALTVFKDLTQHGYDVFIDYDGIASGDFERAIVDNIRARAHFLVLLTPTALERCDDPGDWLRREIEVAIAARRNIVPLLLDGFSFESPIATQRLQGPLAPLKRYQALTIPEEFFDAAMARLRSKYLSVAVEAVLHPASMHAQQVAQEQQTKAAEEVAIETSPRREEERRPTVPPPAKAASTMKSEGVPSARTMVVIGVVAAFLGLTIMMRSPPEESAPAEAVDAAVLPSSDELETGAPSIEPASVDEPATPAPAPVTESPPQATDIPTSDAAKVSTPAIEFRYEPPAQRAPAEAPAVVKLAKPEVLYDRALNYEYGRNGSPQDDVAAVQLYRIAAGEGHAPSQFRLGFLYQMGRGGLSKDVVEAVRWYRMAAEQGDSSGEYLMGVMYEYGQGVVKSDTEAASWYRKAAEHGNLAAQYDVASLYESGRAGLEPGPARVEAMRWYGKAAERGHSLAKSKLQALQARGQ